MVVQVVEIVVDISVVEVLVVEIVADILVAEVGVSKLNDARSFLFIRINHRYSSSSSMTVC